MLTANELPANTDGHIHFLSKGRALTYYKEDQGFTENAFMEIGGIAAIMAA